MAKSFLGRQFTQRWPRAFGGITFQKASLKATRLVKVFLSVVVCVFNSTAAATLPEGVPT